MGQPVAINSRQKLELLVESLAMPDQLQAAKIVEWNDPKGHPQPSSGFIAKMLGQYVH